MRYPSSTGPSGNCLRDVRWSSSRRARRHRYGAVNVASVLSGLFFYREANGMTATQLALVLGGVAVILMGIAVGRGRRDAGPAEVS